MGLEATGWQLEYVALSLEPGSWRLEAGSWKARDWRLEAVNSKLGSRQTPVQLVADAHI